MTLFRGKSNDNGDYEGYSIEEAGTEVVRQHKEDPSIEKCEAWTECSYTLLYSNIYHTPRIRFNRISVRTFESLNKKYNWLLP